MSLADKKYHDLLEDILENGISKGDRTGTGTRSIFGRHIRFNMKDGFPMLTSKKLHIRSIIHELIWFLNGDTNIKYLNDNGVNIWNEWADADGNLGPIYGKQWVNWTASNNDYENMKIHDKSINQIQNAIDRLQSHPDCRRILVTALNPGDQPKMKLPPCHYGFQLWTREMNASERTNYWYTTSTPLLMYYSKDLTDEQLDKLGCPKRKISLMWNQRSVDTGLGLPFNIASYGLLLHMFAQQVNMVPDELIGNLGDTHIYNNHIEQIKEQLKRDVFKYDAPKLKLKKVKDIFSYKFEDFEIEGYECYPIIKMPISV